MNCTMYLTVSDAVCISTPDIGSIEAPISALLMCTHPYSMLAMKNADLFPNLSPWWKQMVAITHYEIGGNILTAISNLISMISTEIWNTALPFFVVDISQIYMKSALVYYISIAIRHRISRMIDYSVGFLCVLSNLIKTR